MIEIHSVSTRQACKTVQLPRSTFTYKPKEKGDQPIIEQLTALVEKHPSIGFWMSYHRIRKQGYKWNHKRIYRVYTAMQLNIRRRAKKRLPARVKQQLFQPDGINQVWSIDFMTVCGMENHLDYSTFLMILTGRFLLLKLTLRYQHCEL